jgi:hypothetical protein
MDAADMIWNRAALSGGGESPGAGDAALTTALGFHGLAMNAGVLDAVERTSADYIRIDHAFRWLGLESVAVVLAAIRRDIAAGALDEDSRAEELELGADERYSAIMPSDAVLEAAFRSRLEEEPYAFASVLEDPDQQG